MTDPTPQPTTGSDQPQWTFIREDESASQLLYRGSIVALVYKPHPVEAIAAALNDQAAITQERDEWKARSTAYGSSSGISARSVIELARERDDLRAKWQRAQDEIAALNDQQDRWRAQIARLRPFVQAAHDASGSATTRALARATLGDTPDKPLAQTRLPGEFHLPPERCEHCGRTIHDHDLPQVADACHAARAALGDIP